MMQISAQEYFEEIDDLLLSESLADKERCKRLKFLFERLCKQVTANEKTQFSNFFSRLSWVSQYLLVDHPTLVKQLNELRYVLNKATQPDPVLPRKVSKSLVFPLVKAVAILLKTEIPHLWLESEASVETPVVCEAPTVDIVRLRVRFISKEEHILIVQPDDQIFPEPIKVMMKPERKGSSFNESLEVIHEGAQLNFLNLVYDKELLLWVADIVVLEPDFLLDISTIAECFKDYGHHPLNYFMSKLTPDQNTHHMLLGNIANQFLDDIVNQTPEEPADYYVSMQKAFSLSPIALATCDALEDPTISKKFFEDTKMQFWHISQVVSEQFKANGFDASKALLEPAFVCEALGVQGRLDLLQSDYKKFIELKSGKAQELYPSKEITHKENHFVQIMLYFAVLQFNLGIDHNEIEAYLLYSRYNKLYRMAPYWTLLKQAIDLRNQIVALEYRMQHRNDPEYSKQIIQTINSDTLNMKGLKSKFWETYLRPGIDEFATNMSSMTTIEGDYFFSLFNFVIKEQYTAKAGDVDAEFKKGVTSLWDATLDEKMDSGEIIKDIKIKSSEISDSSHFITFAMPQVDLLTLPNFRQGDGVMLYMRNDGGSVVTNNQVFKATIEKIDSLELILSLRVIQRNQSVLPVEAFYAIERDHMDSSFGSMLKGLSHFLHATADRKSLLLGQRKPRVDRTDGVDANKITNDFDRVVAKAIQAQDFFLLVGPPGTGKTSCALRQMVDRFYEDPNKNILLLAYTNKAVDEICGSISEGDNPIPFVRIGQEATCQDVFRDSLLRNRIKDCKKRVDVRNVIENHRVFVGTVSSLARQTDLYKIKRFDVAIIDEASQILEPQLLGLLTAKDGVGRDAISKFIMIGDHKQLPAVVVQSNESSKVNIESLNKIGMRNLNESLFQRLYRAEIEAGRTDFIDMLSKQGRMHPAIGDFVSTEFYNKELGVVPLPHQSEAYDASEVDMTNIKDVVINRRFAFFPVVKLDRFTPNKVNKEEASMVAQLVALWYEHHSKLDSNINLVKEVGVITPYRSQIAMIRKELQALSLPGAEQIVIDTVERFQGGQRNLMIYSCCMNAPYQMQFLSNTIEDRGATVDRKLNVALSRARKQLFVVGNPSILKRDAIYRRMLEYLKSNNAFYLGDK